MAAEAELTKSERQAALTAICAIRGCGTATAEAVIQSLPAAKVRMIAAAELAGKRAEAIPLLY